MNSITFATSWGKRSRPTGGSTAEPVGVPYSSLNAVRGIVGTTVEYGKWLELGTPTIDPRPFLRPALEKNKRNIMGI